jgi:hypothetical protein
VAPTEGAFLRGQASRALDGDRDAALSLLRWFNDSIELEEPAPPEILRYLQRAFVLVLSGKAPSADHALGLGKPAHREGGSRYERHLQIAIRYLGMLRLGFEPEIAKAGVQKELGVDKRTIERAVAEVTRLLTDQEKDAIAD